MKIKDRASGIHLLKKAKNNKQSNSNPTILARWIQIASTLALGVIGIYFTTTHNAQQALDRKAQTTIELMSEREQSEMEFRQKMYGIVIDRILEDTSVDIDKRIDRFALFQNNFHNVFDSRAIFDVLGQSIEGSNTTHKKKLISIAKNITEEQKNDIHPLNDTSFTINLINSDSKRSMFFGHHPDPTHGHNIAITLMKIDTSLYPQIVRVKIKITNDTIHTEHSHFKGFEHDSIDISFFDAPLTDNIPLPDGNRIAIILKKIHQSGNSAKIEIIEFPSHYITSGYRPSLNEIEEIIQDDESTRDKLNWWQQTLSIILFIISLIFIATLLFVIYFEALIPIKNYVSNTWKNR